MATYTMAYTGQTQNLSLAAYAAALSAAPVDTTVVDTLELTLFSDTTATTGPRYGTRTFVYKSSAGPVSDPEVASALTNLYTAELSDALASPITAADVVVT